MYVCAHASGPKRLYYTFPLCVSACTEPCELFSSISDPTFSPICCAIDLIENRSTSHLSIPSNQSLNPGLCSINLILGLSRLGKYITFFQADPLELHQTVWKVSSKVNFHLEVNLKIFLWFKMSFDWTTQVRILHILFMAVFFTLLC